MEKRILKALKKTEEKMSDQYESLKADWVAVDEKTTAIATDLGRVVAILDDLANKNLSPEEFADLKASAGQELADLQTARETLNAIGQPVVEE